jgi:hypothetical protein
MVQIEDRNFPVYDFFDENEENPHKIFKDLLAHFSTEPEFYFLFYYWLFNFI